MADVIKAIIQPTWEAVDSHLKMVLHDLEYGSAYFHLSVCLSVCPSIHPAIACYLYNPLLKPMEAYQNKAKPNPCNCLSTSW